MSDLGLDTAVEPGEDGKLVATVSPDWSIFGPNGGYLAAITLRAAATQATRSVPLSITCHFVKAAKPGPVSLTVELLRRSRVADSFRVRMVQDGETVAEALVWLAKDLTGFTHRAIDRPTVLGPEYGERQGESAGIEFYQNVDIRILPRQSEAERQPHQQGWMLFLHDELGDDPYVAAGKLLVVADTAPWAAAVQVHGFFVPRSLDLSVRFSLERCLPGWIFVDAISPYALNGVVEAHARLWSQKGIYLAFATTHILGRNPV